MPRAAPQDLRVTELDLGGERLLVLSYVPREIDLRAAMRLTTSELAVAQLAIAGLSNLEIARRRRTAVRTVANQMASVLQKLGCSSRRELAVRYVRGELDVGSDQSSAS